MRIAQRPWPLSDSTSSQPRQSKGSLASQQPVGSHMCQVLGTGQTAGAFLWWSQTVQQATGKNRPDVWPSAPRHAFRHGWESGGQPRASTVHSWRASPASWKRTGYNPSPWPDPMQKAAPSASEALFMRQEPEAGPRTELGFLLE